MAYGKKMTVRKKGNKVAVKKTKKTPYGKMTKTKVYKKKY